MNKAASVSLTGVLLLIGAQSLQPAAAADVSPLQSNLPEPTSLNEVVSGNPIKLTISAEAPSSDLPVVSGALTIHQAVDTALKNNLAFLESRYDVRIARYRALRELGKFGPTVSFNPYFSTSSLSQMLFNPYGESFGASWPMQPVNKGTLFSVIFAAAQPIYSGGFLTGNYKAAKALSQQSLAGYQLQRIATAFSTKTAYRTALLDEAKLRVDTDYVKFREQSTANMKAKWQAGKVPRADYLREEAELARARVQVNLDYREFNVALVNLKVEMGVNLTSLVELTDTLEFGPDTSDDVNTYLTRAGANRPEIAQAVAKVNEMKGRQLVARSEYLPHVDAYGLGSNVTGNSPDGRAHGKWGGLIGVVGHLTLFDSGQGLEDIRSANAALRQAILARQQVEQKVAQDVTTAWIERETAKSNVGLAKEEIKSAEEDYRLLHARYLVGKAIPLEEFDAAIRLFRARLNLVQAIYDYRVAQDKLVFAAGLL